MAQHELSFDLSPGERRLVKEIVDRYVGLVRRSGYAAKPLDHQMDLAACHNQGCRIDFERLASADDFNLMHDVGGIHRHLDRNTGELMNCFLPRFAVKEMAHPSWKSDELKSEARRLLKEAIGEPIKV